ncbi:MAG TPA: glycosyltransferase [Candidatus Kapabacteria bacterium]|nr:glycosyltransferase [Candidatus Kapabacteria bacterium]
MNNQSDQLDFSVIIPALNEQNRIGPVVHQFHVLDGQYSYEVIVGDGGSTDRTAEIASEQGATVVIDHSERKTVAGGRNAGANIARGGTLIFCDADTRLSNVSHLAESIELLFRDPTVVAAVPRMEVFPEQRLLRDRIFHSCFNALIRTSFYLPVPFSRGQCQIIRANAFHKVGGYNAAQIHADDNTIFQHLAKIGKLKFINDITVYESPRRYRKYGYLQLSFLCVYSIWGQAIFKRNILKRWDRVD